MKLKYEKLSHARQRALLNNSCLRSFGGLEAMLRKAGHHDYEHLVRELDVKFREKLKGK